MKKLYFVLILLGFVVLVPLAYAKGKITIYDHGPQKVILKKDTWNPPLKNFAFTVSGDAAGATITKLKVTIPARHQACFSSRLENGELALFWYSDQGIFGASSMDGTFDLSGFPEDYRPRAKRLITLSANHVIDGKPCNASITIRASDITFSGSIRATANDLSVNAQFK